MIWVNALPEISSWAAWLWQHRQEFEPALQKLGDVGPFANAALIDPASAVRRIGNTLVFGQADGGQHVLAFVEQTGPRIDAIQQAVNGIQAQNAALAASLASLQTVSMVSLGIAALTPVVLTAQLAALGRRLKEIGKMVADIKDMIETRNEAELQTGLSHLDDAQRLLRDGKNATQRLGDALDNCKESMFFFYGLLGKELGTKTPRREVVSLLSRQCAVALGGTVAAHVALGEDHFAIEKFDRLIPRLQEATKWTFERTVGQNSERFLEPGLSSYQVDLTFLTCLFNQANQAGARKSGETYTECSLFEELRPRMDRVGRPLFTLYGSYLVELVRELREAQASIEETNRILGLRALIQEMIARGRGAHDVMEEVRTRAERENTETSPYVVWAMS